MSERTSTSDRRSPRNPARRGAIAVLTALTIPFLLVLTAFAVNVAYMQMVREQLRVACDSTAKAALVNYGATQSTSAAITFAQTVANKNPIAGTALTLNTTNVLFGNATKNGSGVYAFTANRSPMNSVQINGTGSAPFFLSAFLPSSTFNTSQSTTVTRISHDVVLVLDRSASMAFDLSATQFTYPSDRTGSLIANYFTAPSPNYSRWASLTSAVSTFINVLQARSLDVNVGLVTYAEAYTFGTFTSTQASLDVQLTNNYSSIVPAMNVWGNNPLLGDTNISAGLALAQGELTGSRARSTADRTIILLTDGVATTGNTDIPSIATSYRTGNNIVMHTITFSAEAGTATAQAAMQGAATNGNGMYFYAPTSAQLQTAFTTIADSLPAVLVQ